MKISGPRKGPGLAGWPATRVALRAATVTSLVLVLVLVALSASVSQGSTGSPPRVYLPLIQKNAVQPSAPFCTAIRLPKGPTLILTGHNTEMKLFWQWTGNAAFTLTWGRDAAHAQVSTSVAASDTINHLYTPTITGLAPGARYYYRVSVDGQCASGSFVAPPPATAANVKFVAYGDTRTNVDAHDRLAGRVISLFESDPAFQTLSLHVGDWVTDDTESAWNEEWFTTSYSNITAQDASIANTGVRGNHERDATYFTRYFPQPYQGDGLYRSFDYGPIHVALLDQFASGGYDVGSDQYNWLVNDLAASTKTWKFVVLHLPGWSAGGKHPNETTVQNVLQPLFKQYGVSIVFGGHNHYYARAAVDGIQHLTVGGGGAPLSTPDLSYPNLVTASASYSFGQFAISGHTLTATVVTDTGAVIDSFTITR